MKKLFLTASAVLALGLISLQLDCVFTLPPPPPPEEVVVAPPPHPDAVWVAGYWQWKRWHHKYVWVPGHWKVRRHGVWVIVK